MNNHKGRACFENIAACYTEMDNAAETAAALIFTLRSPTPCLILFEVHPRKSSPNSAGRSFPHSG